MFFAGICIHLCFLFSIFDIYFKSPIVQNVPPYEPQHHAVADRLVLFMVDGLRAESFINYTTMPYLRSIANSHGRWGISHTRMPTESRPGHVAVIAGFYEDPSAIAKGWKENPVDFDSVFNQTAYTWSWGTYDILEIFTKRNEDNHIYTEKFDPYDETFSTDKSSTLLDAWVFDNVKIFFEKAKYNPTLYKKLRKNKIAFFLHLLGTDTSGHTHKPKTVNFLTTIRHVDEGIKEIEKVIRDFYDDDGKTTFLMTSDHGMTDWGSHGAGDDHETQTPYVLWGAGVMKADSVHVDPETNNMSLEHRFDMNQADLTPLMSTILSIPVPVNSIGQLRSDILNLSLADKAKAIYSNSRQLASQYDKKRTDVEANALTILHWPFAKFSKLMYDHLINLTERLLQNEDYDKLILFSEEIMNLSLEGLEYYHHYYQKPLLILVTLSFVGWILCLLQTLIEQKMYTQAEATKLRKQIMEKKYSNLITCISLGLLVISTFAVYAQNLPLHYCIYFILPIYLWWNVLSKLKIWVQMYQKLVRDQKMFQTWMLIYYYNMGSVCLALSFTFRWMLSISLFGMGLWPLFTFPKNNRPMGLLIPWMLGCLLLSIFSFMPVVGKDVFIELVIISGVLWLIMVAIYMWKFLMPLCRNGQESNSELVLTTIQMALLVLSLHNIYTQSKRFELGTPVSYFYQIMAWTIAVVTAVLPLIHSRRLLCRLVATNTSLLNFYILLSVSHEGLFMVTLIFNITCWIYMEFQLQNLSNVKITDYSFDENENVTAVSSKNNINVERSLSDQDFRRAFFYITYIILAFFGTGNIASLNSFEVRWVTCFITSFQPFVITGLILLKTLAPFLVVACSFRAIQLLTKAPIGYLNIIVLIYSNIMGVQLLYFVKNTGSWLQIGTSISQYVIVQVITLFIVLINQLAKVLTDVNIYNFANEVYKIRKKYV